MNIKMNIKLSNLSPDHAPSISVVDNKPHLRLC